MSDSHQIEMIDKNAQHLYYLTKFVPSPPQRLNQGGWSVCETLIIEVFVWQTPMRQGAAAANRFQ